MPESTSTYTPPFNTIVRREGASALLPEVHANHAPGSQICHGQRPGSIFSRPQTQSLAVIRSLRSPPVSRPPGGLNALYFLRRRRPAYPARPINPLARSMTLPGSGTNSVSRQPPMESLASARIDGAGLWSVSLGHEGQHRPPPPFFPDPLSSHPSRWTV